MHDITKLGDAPAAKLIKALRLCFNGNGQPEDPDAELTPDIETHWVGRPIDLERFTKNPIVRRLESLDFAFEELSEPQYYNNVLDHTDVEVLIFNLPKLRHLTFTDSWRTRGFGAAFRDARVQCKLLTFGSWESGFGEGDLVAMAESESLSQLTSLRAGFNGHGGRDAEWVRDEIEALARSTHITRLTRLDLSTDQYNDTSLAKLLVTSKNFAHLEHLTLDIPTVSAEFLEVLCQGTPPNGLKLETLRGRFASQETIARLRDAPPVTARPPEPWYAEPVARLKDEAKRRLERLLFGKKR